jgi:hypothetical protein
MTPFAQLDAGLEKTAFWGGLGRGISRLARGGVWKNIKGRTRLGMRNRNLAGEVVPLWMKGLHGTSKVMTSTPGRMAGYYGLAGMASPLLGGPELPGSSLLMNASMPGIGAMFAAPNLITAARMKSQGNQDKLKADLQQGAQAAAGDLMTSIDMDPQVAWRPGYYQQFMNQNGANVGAAQDYLSGKHKPMGAWHSAGALFENPQELINNKIDLTIQDMLRRGTLGKSASMQKSAMGLVRGAFKGIKAVAPYAFPTMGAGMIGHSILRDKPYEVEAVQQRGYAGAQAAIQKRLSNLSGIERFALRLDPTLAARQMNEQFPGAIAAWEKNTGSKYQPGWISKTMDAWKTGGTPSYYTYDAAGERHYIE